MITLLHWPPAFKRYMARLVVKNKHQEHKCYVEIGLCAQKPGALNLVSIVDTLGGHMWSFNNKKVSTLINYTSTSQVRLWNLKDDMNDPQCYLNDSWSNLTAEIACELKLPTKGPHTLCIVYSGQSQCPLDFKFQKMKFNMCRTY